MKKFLLFLFFIFTGLIFAGCGGSEYTVDYNGQTYKMLFSANDTANKIQTNEYFKENENYNN